MGCSIFRRRIALFVAIILAAQGTRPALAADVTAEEVKKSIELAKKFIISRQNAGDGSWSVAAESSYRVGVSSLAVLALLNSGMTIDEIMDVHDELLVVAHFTTQGAQSGIRLDSPMVHLVDFEDGRVRRYRTFTDREQALRAASGG